MPPETPKDFRERAANCRLMAAKVKDPKVREALLYVATRWIALAEEDERQWPPQMRNGRSISPLDC
jgi:hypothetical protein